ncbi:MAG: ATP-binding cassette domain-containing protein [Proteobacteria bacterium]|nr:ATP-binding cassette domain-containing protein [Pseudomonadota bacterium]
MFIARNIAWSYQRDQPLFTNLSFEIKPGEMCHLRGENGVGKTTLLRGLMGLLDLSCTEASLFHKTDIKYFQANTSFLPAESPGFFYHFSAQNNLKFFTHYSDTINIANLLTKWGLSHPYLQNTLNVGMFSTGMKKRLACAKLEVQKRALWLLDEPTHGLDQQGIALQQQLIMKHLASGGMVLYTSHTNVFTSLTSHTINLSDFQPSML